jgi:polar amino acid transport system substrate-binding protein
MAMLQVTRQKIAALGRALLGLLAAWGGPAFAQPGPGLRVCMNEVVQPPWRLADATGQKPANRGLDYEFLQMLGERTGLRITIDLQPWRRCLADLKAGVHDAVMVASFTPERDEMGLYPKKDGAPDESLALRLDTYNWYVRATDDVRWDGKTLTLPPASLVGVQTGYSVAALVRQLGFEVDEAARTPLANLEKLQLGRVSAAALLSGQADAVLASNSRLRGSVRKLEPLLQERANYMVVSRAFEASGKYPVDRLWIEAAAVRDSAVFKRMVKHAEEEEAMQSMNTEAAPGRK